MARRTVAEFIGKSSGFDKVSKDVDKVSKSSDKLGRQQTRLGQASASAGRQFSAQASGLGGKFEFFAKSGMNWSATAPFDPIPGANEAYEAQEAFPTTPDPIFSHILPKNEGKVKKPGKITIFVFLYNFLIFPFKGPL